MKIFSDTCLREGIPVFVIEPRILEAVVSNSSVRNTCNHWCPSWCHYLCTDAEITTFGVLDQFWKKTVILLLFYDVVIYFMYLSDICMLMVLLIVNFSGHINTFSRVSMFYLHNVCYFDEPQRLLMTFMYC